MTFFLHTLAILPGNKIHLSNQRPKPANQPPCVGCRQSPVAYWLPDWAVPPRRAWEAGHDGIPPVAVVEISPPDTFSGGKGRLDILWKKIILGGFKVTWEKMLVLKKRRGEVFWFWSGFCNDISRVHVSICSVLVLGLESKSFEVWKPFVWPMGLSYEAVDISHLVTVVSLSIFQSEYWQFLQILHLRHLNIIDIDCTGTSV